MKQMIIAILCAFIFLSCTPNEKEGSVDNSVMKEDLSDLAGNYTLRSIQGESLPDNKIGKVASLAINIGELQVSGSDGCNNFSGKIKSLSKDEITFGPLAGTRKMCPDMKLSDKFNSYMVDVRYWKLDENTLTLKNEDRSDLLVFNRRG